MTVTVTVTVKTLSPSSNPSGSSGAWRGGRAIAERWAEFVASKGSAWTIDRLIVDPASHQAVIEWTHYKTAEATMLRGDEWYIFEPETRLISEIRAYYAAALDRYPSSTEARN
ncbi:hypothetical protein [Paenarthrobacter nitroguajacolicus]|uniref:hypothetical protein n=1 Tax=Paenarthrobacter nitroguajacolicus TaxID=211146 RepID=UPI0015BBFB9D|nr:hypothetical protein [Paenarthrobacter nitroguajacolicus]NWL31969.1 hypothetical protein [Paenarthrobacter nitroguajacolicus]